MPKFSKYIILFLVIIFASSSWADNQSLNKSYQFANFKEAARAQDFVRFDMKSTKAGLLTTSFTGFARQFSLSGDLAEQTIKQPVITVEAAALDTDIDGRNEKMWDLCLSVKKFPTIRVEAQQPIQLNQESQALAGLISILGKTKLVTIQIKVKQNDREYAIDGVADLKLSELEIPDPSIFIAKVKDDIHVTFHFTHKFDTSGAK